MYETPQSSAAFGMTGWLIILGIYLFLAFTWSRIAKKTGCHNNAWWAYVPILNVLLNCDMAGKSRWWFFLCLVPLVNIVIFAVLWYESARRAGFNGWLGVMVLVPLVNIIALCIMAFTGGSRPLIPQTPTPQHQPRQFSNVN